MAARVLIVEDNAANLELMTYLLGASGYATLIARDGLDGLQLANKELPDLIICDVQMPAMSGYELAHRLKHTRTLQETPLIAVTAFARASDRAEALAAGFDGYLAKPIDPETFIQEIEAFLRPDLRLTTPVPARSVTNPPVQVPEKERTILVVDNVQTNLDWLVSLLEYSGYMVAATHNARGALQLARQVQPDLILSDVCMPESSGYDFIQEVKKDQQLSPIPFVFLTSTATTERDRLHGLTLGATKFLFRPIEPQQLLQEIEGCFVVKANL